MLFEVSKNFGKSSVTLLAEEQIKKKTKMYKTLRKLRFTNINSREKSTDSQFAKLNPRGMLKKMNCELFSLRYSKINFQKNTYATLALKFQANIGRPVNAKQSRLQTNKKIFYPPKMQCKYR